jgi:hypothetical protein
MTTETDSVTMKRVNAEQEVKLGNLERLPRTRRPALDIALPQQARRETIA